MLKQSPNRISKDSWAPAPPDADSREQFEGRPKATRLKEVVGVTDVGRRRRNNEDAIAWDTELGLALVSDGVGGNNGGEVASSTAVRSIRGDLRSAMRAGPERFGAGEGAAALVNELARRAHWRILAAAARDPKLHGMGATLAMALLAGDELVVAHVGDSRVYRLRAGKLRQLTRDHLLVDELKARGCMSEQQIRDSRTRNVLSRALGMAGELEIDVTRHALQNDDLYLLCSDGLSGAIGDQVLEGHLNNSRAGLRDLAQSSIELANRVGGHDNVSAVLMRIA